MNDKYLCGRYQQGLEEMMIVQMREISSSCGSDPHSRQEEECGRKSEVGQKLEPGDPAGTDRVGPDQVWGGL